MRKTFTSILALMAIMFATTASAQKTFDANLEQKVKKTYATDAITFSLSEVATALETDTATLAAALDTWSEAEEGSEVEDMLYIATADGWSSNYTANNGFWLDANSAVCTWGDDARWFTEISWNTAEDAFAIFVGQFPNRNVGGEEYSAKLRLAYNGKTADFNLNLKVLVPAQATGLHGEEVAPADFTIVGNKNFNQSIVEGKSVPNKLTLDIADIYDKLGVDADITADHLLEMVYAYSFIDAVAEDLDKGIEAAPAHKSDVLTNKSTANGGFWMYAMPEGDGFSSEVLRHAWGSSNPGMYFEGYEFDEETKVITGSFGISNLVVGSTYAMNLYIIYDGKALQLTVNTSYEPKPIVEGIHGVEVEESEFAIVGKTTVKSEIYSSTYKTVSVDLSEIFANLGVEPALVEENIADVMYAYSLDDSDVDMSKKSSNLSRKATAGAPGFWMYALEDEDTGGFHKELLRHAWGMSVPGMYYEGMKFDAETMTLSGTLGMNSNTAIGENWLMNIYMIISGKALQITLDNTITKMETVGMDDLKIVGESHIAILHTDGCPDTSVDNDIDAIAEALGCTASELIFKVKGDAESLTESHTANKGGNWMTVEGYSIAWGTSGYAMYVEPVTAGDWSTINYGFNHAAYNEVELGTVFDVQLYYIYEDKAYIVHLDVTHSEAVIEDPNAKTLVRTIERTKQIVMSLPEYETGDRLDFNLDEIEALIGTRSPKFWGEKLDKDGVAQWSDSYSCDPRPGFWMAGQKEDAEFVYVSTWGDTNSFGLSYYSDGTVQFFKHPSFAEKNDHATYKANFYLENKDTHKYIKYVITVQYVDELTPEIEISGSEDLTLAACDDDGYGVYTEVDLSKMLETLGCTIEEFNEGGTWLAKDENGILSEANFEEMEGFFFTEEGTTIGDGTEAMHVGYFVDEEKFFSWIIDPANQDKEYKVEIVAEYNGVRYMFYITVSNAGNGIANVAADNDASQLYDLTGRKVAAPTKGIYIKNGQKFLVK